MLDKKIIGLRLAAYRRELHLTQEQLAEKLGVTPQAISRWETGLSMPEIDSLLAFSKLTKVSINDLIEGEDILGKISKRPFLLEDIAYYNGNDEVDPAWADKIKEQGWIDRNYETHQRMSSKD